MGKPNWPDPTPEMLATPEFEAVWQTIKTWDINVPGAYFGYCGATGNHVRAILDALGCKPRERDIQEEVNDVCQAGNVPAYDDKI